MITLAPIPFDLDPASLAQAARVRPGDRDAFNALVALARQVGRPKVVYAEAFVETTAPDRVQIGPSTFTSTLLRQNLANVARVFAFVATCGDEMDRVALPSDDLLQQFWWDTLKDSLLHRAFQALQDTLASQHRLGKIAVMSPGSGEAEVWPIEQQRPLFALLGDVQPAIGVTLTDSYLMIPNKTISGIIFPTEKDFRTCQVCQRASCPARRAPFDMALWQHLHAAPAPDGR